MLKQRLWTALVLALVVLGAVIWLPPGLFAAFIGAVILLGAWEWSRLAGLGRPLARGLYLAVFLALLFLTRALPPAVLEGLLLLSLLWWAMACAFILLYPRLSRLWGGPLFLALAGVAVLLPGWVSLVYLRGQPDFVALILVLLLAVAAADIGAYFSGRAFGRRKLAPRVSPNKTWEGFWGGVAACSILVTVVVWFLAPERAMDSRDWAGVAFYSALLGMVSVVGDLLESMLKRHRNLKDSGALLPGHGGVLDRIDGITAAAPVYALLLLRLGGNLS